MAVVFGTGLPGRVWAQRAMLRGAGEPTCVFVDGLLSNARQAAKTTGPETKAQGKPIVSGTRCEHALVTVVDSVHPSDATATLAIRLNRVYGRFRAQACREDSAADSGAAPVRFEVWGDDALLWHSAPLRPAGRASVGETTAAVDVPMLAVTTLRLVVRYVGGDLPAAKRTPYARGCVWAMARLLPVSIPTSLPAPVGASPVTAPDTRILPAKSIPVVSPVKSGGDAKAEAGELTRAVLRTAVVRLAALTTKASETAMPPLTLPLRVYIGPFTGVPEADAGRLRSSIAELLSETVGGESDAAIFTVVGDTSEPKRRRRRAPAEDTVSVAAQQELARKAGADWMLVVGVQPLIAAPGATPDTGANPGTEATSGSALSLQIVAVHGDNVAVNGNSAAVLATLTAPLPPEGARR